MLQANTYLVLLHQVVLGNQQAHDRDELFELIDDIAADALKAIAVPSFCRRLMAGRFGRHTNNLKARFGATPFADSFCRWFGAVSLFVHHGWRC